MQFRKPSEYEEWFKGVREAADPSRTQLARSIGITQCYYVGSQWINADGAWNATVSTSLGRLFTNWNPDSNKLRSTINRTARNVIQSAAATFPEEIKFSVDAPDLDAGLSAQVAGDTVRGLTNWAMSYSKFVPHARDANHMRCVCGSWGIGLYIEHKDGSYAGQTEPDSCIKAFTFDPTRLILDPATTSRDLNEHEWVIYEDAWTLDKLRRVFGVEIKDDTPYQTIGNLMSQQMAMNVLSQNQLYKQYRTYSTTKGTMVSIAYIKGRYGRFGTMLASYLDENGQCRTINFDNPENPFKGNGMPLMMLHGHRRPDSPFGIGEAGMLKEDQDQLNLLASLRNRILQAYSHKRWIIDRRNFQNKVSDEQIKGMITNMVGGAMIYESRSEKGVAPPHIAPDIAPPPFLANDMDATERGMQQGVFRAPGHYGELKTHTPDAAVARTMEAADQVLAIRVKEDVSAYEQLTRCIVATNIALFKRGNPSTLAGLRSAGMDETNFRVLFSLDENEEQIRIRIREDSVRFRSRREREAQLDRALQAQALTPMEWRGQLAASDMAVTDTDEKMQTELAKAVDRVLMGETWQPAPLGRYSEMATDLLTQALFDKRAIADPATKQRVIEALTNQKLAIGMEQALLTPPAGPEGAQPQAQPRQPGTLGEVLMQMQGQGAQPVAA